MKKIISLILALCLFVLPIAGCGKEPAEGTSSETSELPENPVEDFEYEENEDGGITITKYIGERFDVVIPGEFDGKPVTRIGKSAFSFTGTQIDSVKIPEGVTAIEGRAFYGCCDLKKADLPETLKTIGARAFHDCDKLESINLPESLTELGNDAFYQDSSLKFIRIPKNIKIWGYSTFEKSGLESVELEEGLEAIGDHAFAFSNLKSVILPKSIRTVETGAFSNCYALANATLNEGLVTIEKGAFDATPLNELVIPASVTNVTEECFIFCYFLRTLKFAGDAPAGFCTRASDDTSDELQEHLEYAHGNYTVYRHESAKGFGSAGDTWNGYPTELW